MYLRTGLGEPAVSVPKQRLVSQCAQWVLNVPFKANFDQFREGVRQAIGRRVTFRSDQGAFVNVFLQNYEKELRNLHDNQLKAGVSELSPTGIQVTIRYAPGFKRETGISIP